MGDSGARITRIEMPDGTEVWARISGAEQLAEPEEPAEPVASTGPSFTDVGARPGSGPSFTDIRTDRRADRASDRMSDRVQARVESLHGVVTSVARSLAEPLRSVRPDEVSVEFGIELTAKAGKVVGLLADGEAKGSIKVTLTWNGGGPPVDPSSPAQVPAQTTGQSAAPPVPSASAAVVPPPVPSEPPMIGPPAPAPAPFAGQPVAGPEPEPALVPVPPSSSGAPDDGEPDGGDSSAGASTGAPAHASGTGPEDGSGS
ncbi:CU044_2847 family protein [Streptomyces sp. NPDC057496]|uniref:CU044_2847 family protein n=1 Tax=Streptomyces sp. NPDC057496 TaxID=3346149 RepID=UPI00369396D4